jgi:hypothetical protein
VLLEEAVDFDAGVEYDDVDDAVDVDDLAASSSSRFRNLS